VIKKSGTFERLGKTEAGTRKPSDAPSLIHRSHMVCTLGLYGCTLSQPRGRGVDTGTMNDRSSSKPI